MTINISSFFLQNASFNPGVSGSFRHLTCGWPLVVDCQTWSKCRYHDVDISSYSKDFDWQTCSDISVFASTQKTVMNRKSQIFFQINSACVKSGGRVNGLHPLLFVRFLSAMTIGTLHWSDQKICVHSASCLLSAWNVKWLDSFVCSSFFSLRHATPVKIRAPGLPRLKQNSLKCCRSQLILLKTCAHLNVVHITLTARKSHRLTAGVG